MPSPKTRGTKRAAEDSGAGWGEGDEPGAGPAPKQQKIEETCSICLMPFQDPAVTMCGHIFCFPCLKEVVHNSPAFPRCPLCRRAL